MTDIQRFYADSTVFLTGATGLVGKLVLEKLLRTCPDVRRVYVLIREKRNKSIQQRFQEMFDAPLWESLKLKNPTFRQKICILEGNCVEPQLGLSPSSLSKITSEVQVVMHCAATVRFNEDITKALKINVRTVMDLMQLTKQMSKLQAFVHVSTAYSNCTRTVVEEKFYDPIVSPEALVDFVDDLDVVTLKHFTEKILGDFPNTYTFTKNLGENVIKNQGKGTPVAIIRPSIIAATYQEPIEGYIDKPFGFSGSVQGIAYGLLRCIHGTPDIITDLIPGDYVANQILTAAWYIGTTKNNTIPIYHCTSSGHKLFTVKEFVDRIVIAARTTLPSERNLWYPFAIVVSSKFWFEICWFFLHTVPGYLLHFALVLQSTKTTKLLRLYKRTRKLGLILGYFMLNQWEFRNDSTRALIKQMSVEDQKLFNFDVAQLDWDGFVEKQVKGVRLYLSDDRGTSVEKGRKAMEALRWYHYGTLLGLGLVFCAILSVIIRFML